MFNNLKYSLQILTIKYDLKKVKRFFKNIIYKTILPKPNHLKIFSEACQHFQFNFEIIKH